MARDRPSPYGEGRLFSIRSAGALGGFHTRIQAGFPRDLSTFEENGRSLETTDVCCSDRCMARDRPSPYGEGAVLRLRNRPVTVARGPVPRDLSPSAENARIPETTDVCCSDRCMARDRPSPYGEGAVLRLRNRPVTVARGPVPRERSVEGSMARDRVSQRPT